MSSYIFFKENTAKLNEEAAQFGVALIKFLIGLILFLAAISVVLLTDLFSSALYYDSLGINLVFSTSSGLFTRLSQQLPQNVSVEGTGFALVLYLLQILFAIFAAGAGSWLTNEDDVGTLKFIKRLLVGKTVKKDGIERRVKPKANDINFDKLNYLLAMFFLGLIDTHTDAAWKTVAGASFGVYFRNFLLSFLYNNLGSEIALVGGFSVGLDGLINLIAHARRGNKTTNKSKSKTTKSSKPKKRGKPNKNTSNTRGKVPPVMPPGIRRVPQGEKLRLGDLMNQK